MAEPKSKEQNTSYIA